MAGGLNAGRASGYVLVMTEIPQDPPDERGSPTSEPFADPDPEALADEEDEEDLDPDDRTADPESEQDDGGDLR